MTKQIIRVLGKGKIDSAKALLTKHYNKEHKSAWLEAMRGEYDGLFPFSIEATFDEYLVHFDGDTPLTSEEYQETTNKLMLIIDYSEDENYVAFNEWIKEVRVIQEAVEEVSHLDDEGMKIIDVAYQPEVTELVRPYTPMTTEEVVAQVDSYIYTATLPKVITMRQARLALLNAGLLTTVTNAITAGTDEALKIEWDYATEVKRDWASLITMATALGLTSEQLDGLFIAGSKL